MSRCHGCVSGAPHGKATGMSTPHVQTLSSLLTLGHKVERWSEGSTTLTQVSLSVHSSCKWAVPSPHSGYDTVQAASCVDILRRRDRWQHSLSHKMFLRCFLFFSVRESCSWHSGTSHGQHHQVAVKPPCSKHMQNTWCGETTKHTMYAAPMLHGAPLNMGTMTLIGVDMNRHFWGSLLLCSRELQ